MRHSPHDALPHPFVDTPTMLRRDFLRVAALGMASLTQMGNLFAQDSGVEPAIAAIPIKDVPDSPASAEMPIDHMTFDEKKELQGEPLARFTKSPEYIGYRDMIKRSIGLLNTASFDRATEHRRIEGALLQLLNIINPLPTEIPELFDQKTRGDVPRLRDGSAHNFPLEWHRRMDGLERFLKTEASRAPVRLPPGKISVSLAISEYQKQTGFQLSFVNERIVFGLPKEIVIRPGANNQLNVLMSIIDIRYTLSFGNDRRVLKIKDARSGDPALIGSGDIVGLMEEGKGIELRSTPSKGALVIPDMHQAYRGGHQHAVHGFRHARKPEHLKTQAEKDKDKELRDCATAVNDENPPREISQSAEFLTGSMRRTIGNQTVECSFNLTSPVGRQEVLPEKEQTADGWTMTIKSETSLLKDREHLDYGWRQAASEQSTYRVRLASGRVLSLKPDWLETSQATIILHAKTKEEPISIIVDAPEEVGPEFEYKIPAKSLEASTKPL